MAKKFHKRIRIKKVLNDVGEANAIKLLLEIVKRSFKVHRDESKTWECSFDCLPHRRLVYHGNVRSYGINKDLDFFGIAASYIEIRRVIDSSQNLGGPFVHVVLINPGSLYSSLSPICRPIFNKRGGISTRHIIRSNAKVLSSQVIHETIFYPITQSLLHMRMEVEMLNNKCIDA